MSSPTPSNSLRTVAASKSPSASAWFPTPARRQWARLHAPPGREDVPLTRTFRGWQLGEPVVAGPHTFTLYVNLNGAVREYEHTVVEGAVDDLHWSPWESLAEMERDLAATAKSHTAMWTAAAPGWSELRDRVAALRAQVESVGGRTP